MEEKLAPPILLGCHDQLPPWSGEEGAVTKEELDPADLIRRLSWARNSWDDAVFFGELLDLRDKSGNTLLHWVSRLGYVDFVSKILEPGPGHRDNRFLVMTNKNGDTAAHEAIRHRHEDIAMELLNKDPSLSTVVNNNLESLLYMAAEMRLEKVVRHLLDLKPEAAAGGPKGRTALHAAVMSGASTSIVQLLLDKRPQPIKEESNQGDIPLHLAAYVGGDVKIASLLLEKDRTTFYHANKDGNTPIHMAAMAGNVPMMRKILKAFPEGGVLINNQGWNVLHIAVQHERADIVEYILRQHRLEGLVNQRDKDGNCPLHLAAFYWNLPILHALLTDAEVDELARNFSDQTALDVFLGKVESEPTPRWFEAQFLLRRHIPYLPKVVENEDTTKGEQNKQKAKEVMQDNLKLRRKAKEVIRARVEKDREKILTVSTLIAAVTLAAAFTVPGGYIGNNSPGEGLPILLRVTAFRIFIVLNVLTICSSLAAIFLCVYASWDDIDNMISYWAAIRILMIFSFYAMTTSFAGGMYTILSPGVKYLAIIVCAMCCSLPFVTIVWARWRDLKLLSHQVRKSWRIERSPTKIIHYLPKDALNYAGAMDRNRLYKFIDDVRGICKCCIGDLCQHAEREKLGNNYYGRNGNIERTQDTRLLEIV